MKLKPYVIVLGPLAVIRVRKGALEIEHGHVKTKMRLDIDEPMPSAIVLDGPGEFLTGDGLRFCARHGVSIIVRDGPGRALSFVQVGFEANEGSAVLADVSPAVIRAQCAADPLIVAAELVRLKIEAELRATEKLHELGDALSRVEAGRTLVELRVVEAKAANAYWRHFATQGLREARGGNLPRGWRRFAGRNKGAQFLGNQHASHPINAMLNYAYIVEAGRLAKALHARGLALTIGFLHADKAGRNSLVWDAIEPRRPIIDARVFAYLARREFKRTDFTLAGRSTVRLKPAIASELLSVVLSPEREIAEAADLMLRLIEGAAPVLKPIYRPDRRRASRKGSF